ncbi:anhydro-N-acetylmuramic acid kinase [Cohnella xylanilytica]|uniref:Anhydro-N-acetylmuramic acid kinase n=1 Tax=Cohnella xylanilytica TaxID=557555 RepID=A0A841U964_9BACL|nr:anhydro-N-acetylmuramic acid kinase [Cohnella xylanilytica]MBB6694644.1 anhydro-N-acetylmuramic acid kinase [Cohnella xylanilytica]
MKTATEDTRGRRRYAVGLMSGTSVDGIDAAVAEISEDEGGRVRARLLSFENKPYPAPVREEIFRLFEPREATVDRVGRMNALLGELYAEAALSAIAAAGLEPGDIAVVGSHGQTIYHSPEPQNAEGYELRYTVQIGEGSVIAARTGIPCVTDFRAADMAVGGQGAPLVPFTEYLLYREEMRTLLLQNIGGIGNITVLPAGCAPEEVIAFDTGPGNMLIDGLVSRFCPGKAMDEGGAIARSGSMDEALLEALQQEPYYRLPPPKSTGRELFGAAYVDKLLDMGRERGLRPEDLIATATQLTAWSIGDAYRRFVLPRHPAEAMIVGGGGSYNPALLDGLKRELEPMGVRVLTQEEAGHHSDAKEAVAFALLGLCALDGRTGNLPSVTGASRPVVLGKLSDSR